MGEHEVTKSEAPSDSAKPPELSRHILHAMKSEEFGSLSEEEKLQVYLHECRRMGLDPASQPIAWGKFTGGKLALYAKRRCGDMLAAKYNISTEIIEGPEARMFGKSEFLYCRVRAIMPDGRHVDDVGTLEMTTGANGPMKVVTKATRRATLRLCGWGGLDESELESIPGARRVEPSQDVPEAPQNQAVETRAPVDVTDPPLEPCDALRSEIKQAGLSVKPGHALTLLAPRVLALRDEVVASYYAETWTTVLKSLPKLALPTAFKVVSSLPEKLRAMSAWDEALTLFAAEGLPQREPGDESESAPRDAA